MFDKTDDENYFDRCYRRLYPDFYSESKKMILDAKYKHLDGKVGRDDLYQVVTYMYCMQYQLGGYIYPSDKDNIDCEYKLAGYGGTIKVLPLYIPQNATNWSEFTSAIKNNEEKLQGFLSK